MATVTLDRVRKSFGDREVVHGVSCAVGDGELVVVVGPSGCGKSTLLRMVAGLEAVSAGSVAIDGRVVNGVEPKDRDIQWFSRITRSTRICRSTTTWRTVCACAA